MAFPNKAPTYTSVAIQRAAAIGFRVDVTEQYAEFNRKITVQSLGSKHALSCVIRDYDNYTTSLSMDELIGKKIDEMVNSLIAQGAAGDGGFTKGASEDYKRKFLELQDELAKYKDAVKMLAFQLEMQKSEGAGTITIESEVRKYALAQAAELVMDWGIPKDGHDLSALCEQITKIPREKGLTDDRRAA